MSVEMTDRLERDAVFMRRALQLARCASDRVSPNPRVGALIVKDGRVIGEGYHRGPGHPHAEVEALQHATGDVKGATMYVTLEPCCHYGRTPPCAPAIIERGISRVVAPFADPNPLVAGQGFEMLREAGITVETGVCSDEAMRLNEAFMTYHILQRPFVVSKWAMTLDGRIATDSGHSKWVSNEESRAYVQEIRAQVDAILVGIGTVLLDNPRLSVRLVGFTGEQPRRIIADGNLRIPLRARCLEGVPPGHCIIATTASAPKDRVARLRDAGHTVLVVPGKRGLIDIRSLIRELHALGIQSLLCEGGSSLNGSLYECQLVDKIVAFIAPKIVGGSASKAPITGWGVDTMRRALPLSDITVRNFQNDICVEGYVFGLFGSPQSGPPRVPDADTTDDEPSAVANEH
jgi:diaminohydroxyphosphoribosylaminopyrimidine deaminase/5-amino-6-(5-phosphoribosylamino)uracil reductase